MTTQTLPPQPPAGQPMQPGPADPAQVDWLSTVQQFRQYPADALAASNGQHQTLTYRALHDLAFQLAHALALQGIAEGQPVAHLLPNELDVIWVSYGLKLAGVADTPLAWGQTADELSWCVSSAQIRWAVTGEQRASELQALGVQVILIEDLLAADRSAAATGPLLPTVAGHQPGRILFTSGTTGRPKALVYSHARRWQGEQLQLSEHPFQPQPGDTLLLMTPFIHGASLLSFAWLAKGAQVILLDGVRLDVVDALFAQSAVQAVFAPPTVLAKITRAWPTRQVAGVRCVFTGTQPLTPGLYQQAHAMFGPVVRITYGKTECINPITVLTPAQTHALFTEPADQEGTCVGWPAPGVELKIDADTDEIWLRAKQMSLGYWVNGAVQAHQPEGWHATGDLGAWDAQGRLRLTGRMADIIKTGGYRVSPDEIESALSNWVDAPSLCVASLPSDYWGEIIIAVMERPKPGWQQEVAQACQQLSRHKQPRLFAELASLPRNAQGKINRKTVRLAVLQTYQLKDGPYPELQRLA